MMKGFMPHRQKVITVLLLITILSLTPITYGLAADKSTSQVSSDAKFISDLKNFIKNNYVEDVSDLELIRGSIKGMVDALDDPYSEFFTPEAFQEFNETASGNFGGIGVVIIMRDNYVTAVSVLEGSPAERAGIKAGDKFVQIDGEDITNKTITEVSKLLKGEKGTKVEIGVLRNGTRQVLKFDVERETIEINPIEYEILEDNIGYLKISEFNEHTISNLDKALNEFKRNGVKGIVLDLRNNPGGILDQAIRVSTRFVPEGPIVSVVSKKYGKVKTYHSKTRPYPFKLVVLINEGSASAAEIVSGAIKDRNMGTLVGETTFGKATVQRTLNLGQIGGVKLTIGRYTTPNGTDINKTGIKPDVEVKVDHGDLSNILPLSGEKTLNSGNVGLDVMALQQRLKLLNLYDKEPDGIYDRTTQNAVKELQRKNDVFPTGVANETFYRMLDQSLVELINTRKDAQFKKAIDVLKQKMNMRSVA